MTLLRWPWRLLTALLWYAKEFVIANLSVTWDIVTPTHLSDPAIVRYDTHCHREWEVSMLSVLIALTPGTIALATHETTDDPEKAEASGGAVRLVENPRGFRIYVHSMFDSDCAKVRKSVHELEWRMLGAMRPLEGPPPWEENP